MQDREILKFGRFVNKVSPWFFLVLAGLFIHGIYNSYSCQDGWLGCVQLIMVVSGLLAVQGLYLIRPWLKVREKILNLAVELKLLDKIPKLKNDMTLEQAAENVIATLSQLQDDARATTIAMRELQQSQSDLLESLPEPVMVLDQDLHILRANDRARELFPDLLISNNLTRILRDPQLLAACQNALAMGTEDSVDFKVTAPVERFFQANIKPVSHSRFAVHAVKSTLLLSLNDITTIKRTEQMRADFVANVSHEMRTPLASIIGFIETLQGPASKDPVAQKNFLKIMESQSKNMSRLVEDLLSLSRIEMREHHQPEDAVEIEPILNNIAVALQMQLADKKMTLQIKAEDNLLPVRGDADELYQVFSNLVTNALRYGYAGTPIQIEAFYTQSTPPQFPAPGNGAVAVRVTDQGVGIPQHHIPRLTERFYRVDKARSREVGGTGLGLAIVKHIINRHRGAMQIESQEQKGSAFTIYLPIYQDLEIGS